jgi:23S rRNA pseudouridine1911/1915/1917 synthase
MPELSPDSKPQLLRDWLRKQFPAAKQNTLRQMLAGDRVRVNGRVVFKMNHPIRSTDRIEVSERVRQAKPEISSIGPMEMVFEDEHLLVIHKPAGLLTSTVPNEKRPTALAILKRYLHDTDPGAMLGLIHRLDRDASGLLVFSKDPDVFTSLKHQFYKHSVRREYLAVVHGAPTPAEGRITTFLVELPDGHVRSTKKPGAGQKAVTDYRTLSHNQKMAAVRVTLQTGRKHQIRAHLYERGVPIVGDRMYGPARESARLMLAALLLEFEHPVTKQRMNFELSAPVEFPLLGGKKLTECG